MSPISSRNSVPPCACSNLPACRDAGAGERALFVAEQLGLDQLLRHRRAVHGDKRPLAARAAIVNRARDQFFAGAGLAENADARFAGGNPLHHAP